MRRGKKHLLVLAMEVAVGDLGGRFRLSRRDVHSHGVRSNGNGAEANGNQQLGVHGG